MTYVFIAGVQKGATNTLWAHLSRHPAIAPASKKEPHFFDDETMNWTAPDYSRFDAWFADRSPGRIRLDATPIYTFWPQSLERIRGFDPEARIIVSLRDPIERAFSHWRMARAQNWDANGFSYAIRAGRELLTGLPKTADAWRFCSYVERGFYAGQVERLLSLFPRANVLFVTAQELARDAEVAVGRLTEFLGIEPLCNIDKELIRFKARDDAELPVDDAAYLAHLFRDDLERTAALTGIDVSDWPTMTFPPTDRLSRS